MMNLKLEVATRNEIGTGGSHKVRQSDMVPGVIYARGEDNLHIKVDEPKFRKAYREAGSATILGLDLDGKEIPVIIKEVQKDPIKDEFIHVDFQKVSMDETIRVLVPIVLEGRDDIKVQPSILAQQLDEIEIECLPMDLPEGDIELDVSEMQIGDSIMIEDLDIAKDEKITILRDLDDVICSLSEFIEEDVDAIEDEDLDMDVEPELVSDSEEEEEDEE